MWQFSGTEATLKRGPKPWKWKTEGSGHPLNRQVVFMLPGISFCALELEL